MTWNKHKLKAQYLQAKQHCKYWYNQSKLVVKQVFIPLAIFQLARTIFFPTAFDVFLLVIIFIIIASVMLE